jgi:hypothetical protein
LDEGSPRRIPNPGVFFKLHGEFDTMEKRQEIATAIKRIVHAIGERELALDDCCPYSYREVSITRKLKDVAIAQKNVDGFIVELRTLTEERLKDFSDQELLLAVYLWCGIWCSAAVFHVDSHDIASIVGRNKPEEVSEVAFRLLEHTSPLSKIIAGTWSTRESIYDFSVKDPGKLAYLFFGEIEHPSRED